MRGRDELQKRLYVCGANRDVENNKLEMIPEGLLRDLSALKEL